MNECISKEMGRKLIQKSKRKKKGLSMSLKRGFAAKDEHKK